jgi:nucleoside-diphosphate-sugar epimerase
MRVAVIGATGFIGKHVVNKLLNQHSVEVFAISRQYNEHNKKEKNISYVNIDIGQPPDDIFKVIGSPDVVIHLAWENLANYKALQHFEIELSKHYNFLKKLINDGLRNLIVTGTCFEYGLQFGALSADLNTNPITPYGFAKDTLRRQLEFLQLEHNYNLSWARLFYIFGEGQPDKALFSQLIKSIKNKEKSFNMSGGQQIRDYLPVTEVASQLVDLSITSKNNGVLNICSEEPQLLVNIVKKWIVESSSTIEINLGYYPYKNYEPMNFWGVK